MKMMNGSSRIQAKSWITLGLLAGVMLIGAVVVNAENILPGAFEAVESGMNHKELPVDSHHMCGVGRHSLFGHYTACIALVTASKGIIEYQFDKGDAIYGTVELKATTTPGLSTIFVIFTKGTGRFRNVSGYASGSIKSASKELGVQLYSAKLAGNVDNEK
jgi:hypothetical protein